MNTIIDSIKRVQNIKETENCGVALKTTLDAVYDMFALGGAYRSRSEDDCIFLFKKAYEENADLALKCLFYLRDIREGQGERRFFRICLKWLAKNYPEVVSRNLKNIPELCRWDDLYSVIDTPVENQMFDLIKQIISEDLEDFKNEVKGL